MARKQKCVLRRPAIKIGALRRPTEQSGERPYRNPDVQKKVQGEITEGKHIYDRLEVGMSEVAEKLWGKRAKKGTVENAKTDHGVRPLLPFFFGVGQQDYFKHAVKKLARATKSKYPDGNTELLMARIAYLDHLGHGDEIEVLNWWRGTKDGKKFASTQQSPTEHNPRMFFEEGLS